MDIGCRVSKDLVIPRPFYIQHCLLGWSGNVTMDFNWYNDVVRCKVCSWQSTCKHLLRGIFLTMFLTSIFLCPPLSSSDTSSGSYMYHDEVMDETGTSKPKIPLDEEWTALAKKMLKGGDPEKTLTWRTAEVCHVADGCGGRGLLRSNLR